MDKSRPVPPRPGPYTPALILHGGAGSIARSRLPPALYSQYAASLTSYVTQAHDLLRAGHTALEAACHAVALMEDDPLFNCGKGAVFTDEGTNELEASVMVTSVDPEWKGDGSVKRGAAVSLITETRHPILLAREVLLQGDRDQALGSMHCHRSGRGVEEWGWKERGLERKEKEWFWTKKRWEEHLRGLKGGTDGGDSPALEGAELPADGTEVDGADLPSQGTVGAVCMDSWGSLAVATSTGGLTNKKPGRIGDTPTLGAGFWAESWDEERTEHEDRAPPPGPLDLAAEDLGHALSSCIPGLSTSLQSPRDAMLSPIESTEKSSLQYASPVAPSIKTARTHRRAVAMSGTGNGDSFLRVDAVRTAAAMCRFGGTSLIQAVTSVAGHEGELQSSAGDRWSNNGEGEGGIIGIAVVGDQKTGHVTADFNCGGMWRAWIDRKTGKAKVMVFRKEYK